MASLLITCNPSPYPASGFHDLCWVDERTLVAAQYTEGRPVLKFDIDMEKKTCQPSVISNDFYAWKMACDPGGQVFIVDRQANVIRIFDLVSGRNTTWQPEGIPYLRTIAMNSQLIAVDYSGSDAVTFFNKGFQFLYRRSITGKPEAWEHMDLSEDGLLVTLSTWHDMYIHDLKKNESIEVKSGGRKPIDACSTPCSGHVLASDRERSVSVYTREGKFVHILKIELEDDEVPYSISVQGRGDKPSLMALSMMAAYDIKIYALT